MAYRSTTGAWRLIVIAAGMLLLAAGLAGCSSAAPSGGAATGSVAGSSTAGAGSSGETTAPAVPTGGGGFGSGADTAQGYYDIAYKAAKGTAPDAVFFVAQVPTIATTTPSPSWDYLFGSKKTNKVYLVSVTNGKALKPQDLGASSVTATQWATIPSVTEWKVDSNVALAKAAAAYQQRSGKAVPSKYAMGMASLIPSSASGIKPFVWSVTFDPAAPGATKASQIDVDARTGAVLPPTK